ncbi:MAG: hypothetical protein KDE52_14400 [Calditrichaeota bacterium]|nr:hypothetical protein [Calditrichota bacterium]
MKPSTVNLHKNVFRNHLRSNVFPALMIGALLLTLLNCAPVFSDLQSARMVEKDKVEITPSYSSISFSEDGESGHVQNHYGLQIAHGSTDKANLRFRYERIQEEDFGLNVIGLGPKYAILPNRIAFYCPFGMAFGDEIDIPETYEIHPTLLMNVLENRQFDLYVNSKVLIPIARENGEILIAFNIGAAVGPDLGKFAIRPEIGYLFNPEEKGHFRHLSIGFSVTP